MSYAPRSALARVVVLVVGAFWLGGLTFYAAVVIPTAHDVLGSHREVGFITRQVSGWINVAGAAALAVLLLNGVGSGRWADRRVRVGLAATWAVMAAVQVGLFALHPVLDRLLDPEASRILDKARFYALHRAYLISTTGQMLAGVAHVYFVVRAWQQRDTIGGESRRSDAPALGAASPARQAALLGGGPTE